MRIVHLTTNDEGGAYQAAVRISRSMKKCGADSYLVLRNKNNSDNEGYELYTGIRRLKSKFYNFLNLMLSFGSVQSDYFGSDITGEELIRRADVIVLHWTNSFISYRTLKKLQGMGKPVIWVMHDMWLMTGGCHIDKNCRGYERGCTGCPEARNMIRRFIAVKNFRIKEDILRIMKPYVVTPSRWLGELKDESAIFRNIKSCVINNPVDTGLYHPYSEGERGEIRDEFSISRTEKMIVFCAFNAVKNTNKGFGYLKKALAGVDKDGYTLLICGSDNDESMQSIGRVKVRYAGYVEDISKMSIIYSSADVVVSPSKQENYSGVILEALSCGTPVTAFAIGGTPEIIDHLETGYIAPFGDTDKLREGIIYCCDNKDKMSERAREVRVNVNSYERIGEKYLEIVKGKIS